MKDKVKIKLSTGGTSGGPISGPNIGKVAISKWDKVEKEKPKNEEK